MIETLTTLVQSALVNARPTPRGRAVPVAEALNARREWRLFRIRSDRAVRAVAGRGRLAASYRRFRIWSARQAAAGELTAHAATRMA